MLLGAICDLSLYILAEDANYLENSSSPNFSGIIQLENQNII